MKRLVPLLSYLLLFTMVLATPALALTQSSLSQPQETLSEVPTDNVNKEMVQDIIAQMTPEEKIGQLVMPATHDNRNQMPNEDTKELIKEYKAGSVIIYGNRNARKTAEYNNQLQEWASETRLSVPLFSSADLEYGINQHVTNGTAFPRQMGIGATRNLEAAKEMASVTAQEMKATGFNWNYSPLADVNTNPDNPVIGVRAFGEDTDLVSDMTVAQVRGYQEGGVLSTPKHFPGHGDTSEDSHHALPAVTYDRETLEEVHLPPFQAAIDAGTASMMTSHIIIEAIDPDLPATLSEKVLTELLREEMGFGGIIVTDAMSMDAIDANWGAGEAGVMAIQAGADIVMATGSLNQQKETFETLLEAYESGELSQERVDQSLERILTKKVEYDLFDNRFVDPEEAANVVSRDAHKALARDIAQQSITLVKNENILPFEATSNESTFVVGPRIYNRSYYVEDIEKAVEEKTNGEVWSYITSQNPSSGEIDEAIRQAENADRIIVLTFSASALAKGQRDLVNAFVETEKPMVTVSLGLPYDIKEYPDVNAHLATYAIERWGSPVPISWEAAVDVIYGAEPGGKLPVSIEGLYEFGHGESYDDTPLSASEMKTLVEDLEQKGEIENNEAAHSLKLHLTVVSLYEEKEAAEKVVKHMEGFKYLIDYQLDNELISNEVFNILQTKADDLIKAWQ